MSSKGKAEHSIHMKLKEHNIELGLIDDAKLGSKEILDAYNNPIWNQLERLPNNILEIISEAKRQLMLAGKGQAKAIENARKVSAMAKELGIPNPKEIDDIFKNNDYDTLADAFATDLGRILQIVKNNS
jgi:hypothetical protein